MKEVVSFLGVVVPAGLTLGYNIAQCLLQYSNNGSIKQVNGSTKQANGCIKQVYRYIGMGNGYDKNGFIKHKQIYG